MQAPSKVQVGTTLMCCTQALHTAHRTLAWGMGRMRCGPCALRVCFASTHVCGALWCQSTTQKALNIRVQRCPHGLGWWEDLCHVTILQACNGKHAQAMQ